MSGPQPSHNRTIESKPRAGHARPLQKRLDRGARNKTKNYGGFHYENQVQQTVRYHPDRGRCTCCGALGVFAADDAKADTAAATTASETVNTDNDHNSSLSIGLVAAALATGLAGIGGGMAVASAAPAAIAANSENEKTFGKSLIFVALGESIALYGLVISIMILSKLV